MAEPDLAQIQEWIACVLTTRGALPEKLARAASRFGFGLDSVVADRPGASAHRRLDVYARSYVLRLVQCLREEYPDLHRYLGDSVFDAFAKAYLIERPPSSPSLFDLGAGYADFLATTRPARRAGAAADWLDLPAEIARLERARAEAARDAGLEPSAHAPPVPSTLSLLSGRVRLRTPGCLRLVQLGIDLLPFLARLENGSPQTPPQPAASFVAVSRQAYRLTEQRLEPWQFALLDACRRADSARPVLELARNAKLAESQWGDVALWVPVAESLGFVEVLDGVASRTRAAGGGRALELERSRT